MILDFAALKLGWRPNQFLMLPAGFLSAAQPHMASPVFAMGADALLASCRRVALAEPRTTVAREDAASRQVEFVQRSAVFRFPDTITVQAVALPDGRSALAAYARATYGVRDFGVNRNRVQRWAAKIVASA